MADSTTLESFFRVDGAAIYPSVHTHGPWDPNAQHGGAPAALIAWTVSRIPTSAPMRIARLSLELFRPVPVAPLTMETEIIREGRNIQLVELRLFADGKESARATILRMRENAVDTPLDVRTPPQRWKHPDDSMKITNFARAGLAQSLDIRAADGRMRDKNAPPVWFKLNRPLVNGEQASPVERACITADFCNGMSGILDWNEWTFINADLSIQFARDPIGEWMMLEAQGMVGTDGRGIAYGVLSDLDGAFGRASQSLVIARR